MLQIYLTISGRPCWVRDVSTGEAVRQGNDFFKILSGHMSIFGATILDFCWHLWVSKPEWAALIALGRGVHDICSMRFTSGATPLLVYMASIVAICFLHMHFWGRMPDSNGTPPAQQSDALTTRPQRPADIPKCWHGKRYPSRTRNSISWKILS